MLDYTYEGGNVGHGFDPGDRLDGAPADSPEGRPIDALTFGATATVGEVLYWDPCADLNADVPIESSVVDQMGRE